MCNYFKATKYTLIYVFRIPDDAHKDCLKVGKSTFSCPADKVLALAPNAKVLNEAARKRINEYTQTASIYYELLYTETAVFRKKDGIIKGFSDTDVHNVLTRSGIPRKEFTGNTSQGTEWFITDLETVKNAIKAVKEERKSLTGYEITKDKSPVVFRPEQRDAIGKTKKQFRKANQMLWNAKMRFGKTLSALQVVKELEIDRTLILTHRPVVVDGWFEDFNKIFIEKDTNYRYGSKKDSDSFDNLVKMHHDKGTHFVYFASMQDLRGSETVGGKFDKNDEIFSTPWDLLIIDEAHEGTQTELGKAVQEELIKPGTKVLRLSGTPFNLLQDYKEDEIYTWDYVMEQRAKKNWDTMHFGDPNPYAELPTLNIYTYDLGRLLSDFIDEDVAFNFREFFRVNGDGTFVHEEDVLAFLNLLTKEDEHSMYPFANEEYRTIFRHTLWMVPGVKAAKALSAMLQTHPVFQHFKIVNVAGDGDEDVENKDALAMVDKAIGPNPDETYTITLSCGRLTTGVTVKAWTGVLMLSGSYSTAASSYMQTIFRVQSPATINGHVKEDCYVFDFAPDRTLQVLATVPRVSTKAGKTNEGQRKALGEFLNFCPVISVEGSEMKALNTDHMLQQLKRAYVERVVRNGFEDGCLYNDELMKLTELEVKEFEDLSGVIGKTKAIGKVGSIDINSQGLTNEEYEEKEQLEKKKKAELTEEEKARLEEFKEKTKHRKDAISVLRSISIRMPLLIYGAEIKDEDKELTIDNFTSLVDAQSWEEFMPRGVTKQKFNQFKKYYDPDIFAAAGKRIRAMARAADKLTVEERIERITDIFSTFRNPDKETVLTPWRVVNMHLGYTLGGYCFFDEAFKETLEEPRYIDHGGVTDKVFSTGSYLLEINSKSGLYPLYLAYNVYRRRVKESMISPETLQEHQAIWDEAVKENIFVICKTPMAKSITRRTLVGFRQAKVNTHYFEDLINQIKNKSDNILAKVVKGKSYWKANENDNMKFNAVVGNPPYQESSDANNRNTPIYHYFYDFASKLADIYTLISPARFLYNAGLTPPEWNQKMLNDPHFMIKYYEMDSDRLFPRTDIKGGIVITMRDVNQHVKPIVKFLRYKELESLASKFDLDNANSLKSIVFGGRSDLKFNSEFLKKYPESPKDRLNFIQKTRPVVKTLGQNEEYELKSSTFDALPYVFKDKVDNTEEYYHLLGLTGSKRIWKYVRKTYMTPRYMDNNNIERYKVFLPKANGSGKFGETLSKTEIGRPSDSATPTFISIGSFKSEQEAISCSIYLKTKFLRCLLGLRKSTQDNPPAVWSCIPLEDFTPSSDIDWSQSVADVDRQLYAKYGLTEEEIEFIERMIKPM